MFAALHNLKMTLLAATILLTAAASAQAVNPLTNPNFVTVNVNGNATFADGTSVSVVQDGPVYTMFYRNFTTDDGSIGELRTATSFDGVNYVGGTGGAFLADPFPTGTPPYLYYENVSRVGTILKVQHWTSNGDAGSYPNYNYNISISDGGLLATNLYTHQGPVSGGTLGQTAGSFGIVDGNLYGQGGSGRELSRGAYNALAISVASFGSVKDFQPLFNSLGIPTGYINNHSDVLQLDNTGNNLGLYFTVRDGNASRFDQQVYYSESTDGGATWTDAVASLTSPTLDGGAFGGNFAHADAVPGGLYIGSQNANGDFIVGFAAIPEPGTIALAGVASLGLMAARRRLRRS